VITTSEIEHISPLAHQHIHLYGHYPFDLATRPDGHRWHCESALGSTSDDPPPRKRSRDRRRAAAIGVIQMSPLRSSGFKLSICESARRPNARFPHNARLLAGQVRCARRDRSGSR
jgi:hypothetical protein